MSHTIVKKSRLKDAFRKGRGFSLGEIKEAVSSLYEKHKSSELSLKDFMKGYKVISGVKTDPRRRSTHKSNVEFLKNLAQLEKAEEKKAIKPKKKPAKKAPTPKKPAKKTSAPKKTAKKKSTAKKTAKKTSTAKKTAKKKSTAKKTAKKTSTAKKSSKKTTRKKSSKKTTTKT